ncbi:flagellar hook-associated protein FlgL [Salinisphaera sp.]|uniref:flagellar hook-associated protein FlgL n=1 Tax=Salinisphaera sp. TaxID=1914330 RepID=UPI000C5856D4|nr:flagellar hook-associated protein FlgL [Salinisphaera sp.]MBS64178.1 flagellar hook-associated protein 3 [Salinisphaera sp.]
MRLSTNSIYSMSTQSILRQQGQVAGIGQQLASGKKIVTPADDPRAASQALVVSQASAVNDQFEASRTSARRSISAEETQLDQVTRALQAVTPQLVKAGNGTLSDADRNSIATDLEGIYAQMLGSANAQDGNGRFIFAGHDGDKTPFVESGGRVSYQGDEGLQNLRVDASRMMAINDTGSRVFTSVTESAQYVGTADGGNAGTGVFGSINVADASSADFGNEFQLSFSETDGEVRYSVANATTGETLVADQPYVAGEPIELGESMRVTIKGTPADGDGFTFARDREEDNNILNTLAEVIDVLKTGTDTPASRAALENGLNSAHRKVANSLDNVLTVRASLGSRLNELDTLDTVGAARGLNYDMTRSQLEDLDYMSAYSDYSLAQVALQFSQKTFTDIQKLSMFSLNI